jgi:hypothetical protein
LRLQRDSKTSQLLVTWNLCCFVNMKIVDNGLCVINYNEFFLEAMVWFYLGFKVINVTTLEHEIGIHVMSSQKNQRWEDNMVWFMCSGRSYIGACANGLLSPKWYVKNSINLQFQYISHGDVQKFTIWRVTLASLMIQDMVNLWWVNEKS